jgi:hypothetical protein
VSPGTYTIKLNSVNRVEFLNIMIRYGQDYPTAVLTSNGWPMTFTIDSYEPGLNIGDIIVNTGIE